MAAAPTPGLRMMTGLDELLVQDAVAAGQPRVVVATRLLGACLDEGGEERALAMTVGRRETLLLELRRGAFGERIEAVVSCPRCAETLDLDLATGDLLAAALDETAHVEMALEAEGSSWRAVMRPVTGADQTAAIGAADPAALLLRRCVASLMRDDGVPWPLEELTAGMAAALDDAMRRLDPMAEISLDLVCPACRHRFTAPFDAAGQLFAELAAEADQLLREVMVIGRACHWSEGEILGLPRPRRRAYATLATVP
ncbi:MAG: hypothetical protein R3D25_04645 [Geminicoccaceae bacterium]